MRHYIWYSLWVTVVGLHHMVIFAVPVAVICNILYMPWYVSLFFVIQAGRLLKARTECPLTNIENYVRLKIKKEVIKGFVKHYYMRTKP